MTAEDMMRQQAMDIFMAGVRAADPANAIVKNWYQASKQLAVAKYIHVIGLGKAAVPMTRMALELLPAEKLRHVLAITNYENVPDSPGFTVFPAGHPVPDKNGVKAAETVISLSRSADHDALLLLLLSGGGSALMPAPLPGLTLNDKKRITDLLLKSGADIQEMNTVRRSISQLKGGGLAQLAHPAKVVAFILSDVPGDSLPDIASGPTVPGSRNSNSAMNILDKYNLVVDLPPHMTEVIQTKRGLDHVCADVTNILIGSNRMSVAAMEQACRPMDARVMTPWLEGDVDDAADEIIESMFDAGPEPCAIVCGGETAVRVRGDGLGGRNQELALRLAAKLDGVHVGRKWVFLSGGTDGRDGPTDAAGGIVDTNTIWRLKSANIDLNSYLERNDSYHALQAIDGLVVTSATGTNVADLQILLLGPLVG